MGASDPRVARGSVEKRPVPKDRPLSQYQQLIQRTQPPSASKKTAEGELDRLLQLMEQRRNDDRSQRIQDRADPIQLLRQFTIKELVPAFVELVEKYSKSGMAMHMDASNLLEGGRDMRFEFALAEHRIELQGTVTTDAIAFHELRTSPHVQGQMIAGPMLRLKQLTPDTFREFICARLAQLIRFASRR